MTSSSYFPSVAPATGFGSDAPTAFGSNTSTAFSGFSGIAPAAAFTTPAAATPMAFGSKAPMLSFASVGTAAAPLDVDTLPDLPAAPSPPPFDESKVVVKVEKPEPAPPAPPAPAAPQRTRATRSSSSQPPIRRRQSDRIRIKQEASRSLPARHAKLQKKTGFYAEANLTKLAWRGAGTRSDPIHFS